VAKKQVKKAQTKKFTIDCSEPVEDGIFDIASFVRSQIRSNAAHSRLLTQEKFLHERIKVAGKTGVLQDHITIERDGSNINVSAKIDFSKRYLAISRSVFASIFLNLFLACFAQHST